MTSDTVLRQQLLALLRGGNAHLTFEQAVADFPLDQINRRPPNVPYSPWHLLEHLRIAQWDILEFVRNPAHVSPPWPQGYWPRPEDEADAARWNQTIRDFCADLKAVEAIVQDPQTEFFADLPHAKGYTVLREVLLVADHNAYHIGEFAILRQVMGTWPPGR
jgi:hypothetical protein